MATPERVIPMLEQFLRHDWRWYGELAVAAAEHAAGAARPAGRPGPRRAELQKP